MIRLPVVPSIIPAVSGGRSDPRLSLNGRAPQTVQQPRQALSDLAWHRRPFAPAGPPGTQVRDGGLRNGQHL